MKQDKKVSIAIPCYNGSRYLEKTLRSALDQDYKNLEVIYVDDASTDDSLNIANSLRKDYYNLKVFANKENQGVQKCWNLTLSYCDGEYIKLLCADDIIYPDTISRQVEIFQSNPRISVITSDNNVIDHEDKIIYRRRVPLPKSQPISKELCVRACLQSGTNILGEPSIVFMRGSSVRKSLGFQQDFKYAVDLDFFLELLDDGDLWVDSGINSGFRMHPQSLTHQGLEKSEDELIRCFYKHSPSQLDAAFARSRIKRKKLLKRLFLSLTNNSLGITILRELAKFPLTKY